MAEYFGGKWVYGGGLFLAALSSLLTPLAARSGFGWLIAARVFLGLGQVWTHFVKLNTLLKQSYVISNFLKGVTFSSIMNMNGKWIPRQERSILVAFILSGNNIN